MKMHTTCSQVVLDSWRRHFWFQFEPQTVINLILIQPILFVLQPLSEPLLEQWQLGDEIRDGVHEGVVGRVVRGGLDPEHHLVLHGVRVLVAGEQHVGVLEELLPDHVAHGVVLLVDGEHRGVGNLGVLLPRDLLLALKQEEGLECGRGVHTSCFTVSCQSVVVWKDNNLLDLVYTCCGWKYCLGLMLWEKRTAAVPRSCLGSSDMKTGDTSSSSNYERRPPKNI